MINCYLPKKTTEMFLFEDINVESK